MLKFLTGPICYEFIHLILIGSLRHCLSKASVALSITIADLEISII